MTRRWRTENIKRALSKPEPRVWHVGEQSPVAPGWYRVRQNGVDMVRALRGGKWWMPEGDEWKITEVHEWCSPRICPIGDLNGTETSIQLWWYANKISGNFDKVPLQ